MGAHRAARGLRAELAKIGRSRDARSVSLQEQLRADWTNRVRRLPPAQRETWLRSAEAIVALGARQCAQLRRQLLDQRDAITAAAPSGSWIDGVWFGGDAFPASVAAHMRSGRRYAVRMVLSAQVTRVGLDGVAARRWTPPQCCDDEDLLDGMGVKEATFYVYPPSPSAITISRIRDLRAKERRRGAGFYNLGRSRANVPIGTGLTPTCTPLHAERAQRVSFR